MAYPGGLAELGSKAKGVVNAVQQAPIIDQQWKQWQAKIQNMDALREEVLDEMVTRLGIQDHKQIDKIRRQLALVDDPDDMLKVVGNIGNNTRIWEQDPTGPKPTDVFDDTFPKFFEQEVARKASAQKQQQGDQYQNWVAEQQSGESPAQTQEELDQRARTDLGRTHSDSFGKSLPTQKEQAELGKIQAQTRNYDAQAAEREQKTDPLTQLSESAGKAREAAERADKQLYKDIVGARSEVRALRTRSNQAAGLVHRIEKAMDGAAKTPDSSKSQALLAKLAGEGLDTSLDGLQAAYDAAIRDMDDINKAIQSVERQVDLMESSESKSGLDAAKVARGEQRTEEQKQQAIVRRADAFIKGLGEDLEPSIKAQKVREYLTRNNVPRAIINDVVRVVSSGGKASDALQAQASPQGVAQLGGGMMDPYRKAAEQAAQAQGFTEEDPEWEEIIQAAIARWKQ